MPSPKISNRCNKRFSTLAISARKRRSEQGPPPPTSRLVLSSLAEDLVRAHASSGEFRAPCNAQPQTAQDRPHRVNRVILVVGHHFRFAPSSGYIATLKLLTPCANRRTGRTYRWPSALSWDRRRSPREVVRPKVDGDGRQAQRYANPEDRRMMERSSVARSGLHSITSSARESGGQSNVDPNCVRGVEIDGQFVPGRCRTG